MHTHTPKAGLLGPIAAKMAGTPIVVHTIHGLLFHDRLPLTRQAAMWAVEKTTAIFSDHLLSQSQEDVDVAIRTKLCAASKIKYLGNGVDICAFSPAPHNQRDTTLSSIEVSPQAFVVGTVARRVREKGLTEFCDAAEHLTARYPDLKFVVIGPQESGHTKALDPTYIHELQRRGIVVFVGWQDEMRRWYEAMDVFVLASYREGVPVPVWSCRDDTAHIIPMSAVVEKQ